MQKFSSPSGNGSRFSVQTHLYYNQELDLTPISTSKYIMMRTGTHSGTGTKRSLLCPIEVATSSWQGLEMDDL